MGYQTSAGDELWINADRQFSTPPFCRESTKNFENSKKENGDERNRNSEIFKRVQEQTPRGGGLFFAGWCPGFR